MTVVASVCGYRDGSGIHCVIERLEQHALRDLILAHRLRSLTTKVSSVKS